MAVFLASADSDDIAAETYRRDLQCRRRQCAKLKRPAREGAVVTPPLGSPLYREAGESLPRTW